MDPDTDIETRTPARRPLGRASRAPWDPPPRPAKPASGPPPGARRVDEPAVLGGFYDDLGRGVD